MRIIFVGDLWVGSTSRMRFDTLKQLGHTVLGISACNRKACLVDLLGRFTNKLGFPLDSAALNARLLAAVRDFRPNLVWIEKRLELCPRTLRHIRNLDSTTKLVFYSLDDMSQTFNQSRYYLSATHEYDLHVTTKSYNVPELRARGAQSICFVDNACHPPIHRPRPTSPAYRQILGGTVGFIGAFEGARAELTLALANSGMAVRIFGGRGWTKWNKSYPNVVLEGREIWAGDYATAISNFDINLCFLRRCNRDLQTTRSVEIPACGGFMLAERTKEHVRLFKEGIEAEYFGCVNELIDKVRFYTKNSSARMRIAEAGRRRVIASRYDYGAQLSRVLGELGKGSEAPAWLF